MAEELQEYHVPQLVIHGGINRAKQFGYSQAVGGVASDVASKVQAAFGGTDISTSHFYGNPAFCMELKLNEFSLTMDGYLSINVAIAQVCKFPLNSYQWGMGWDYSKGPVTPSIGYNNSYAYCKFTPTFKVYANIIKNNQILQKILLFNKNTSQGQWNAGTWKYTGGPITTKLAPLKEKDVIIIAISIIANCSCNQTGVDRPVFAEDITAYIPDPTPYIWEYQSDKKWHLRRPFYVASGNAGGWRNAEDVWEENRS